MKIELTSVSVEDQEVALRFYTEILLFEKKSDLLIGDYRWLTVVAPDGHDDVELLLEPNSFEPAAAYQEALYNAGIPCTAFAVDDIDAEYRRLKDLGVRFQSKPTSSGPVTVAAFDDTCGNLIQIYQR
jgi:catechol 2,3-dioxygenase-like lactoylglutathione lyase family enzyme